MSEFKKFGPSICKYFMKKNEPFKVRDLFTIICEIVEENDVNSTICASPSPKFNIEVYTKNSNNYNNSFNNFIEYVKKVYSAIIPEGIEYDINFDHSIYYYISGLSISSIGGIIFNYSLSILSNHSQKIKCF